MACPSALLFCCGAGVSLFLQATTLMAAAAMRVRITGLLKNVARFPDIANVCPSDTEPLVRRARDCRDDFFMLGVLFGSISAMPGFCYPPFPFFFDIRQKASTGHPFCPALPRRLIKQ